MRSIPSSARTGRSSGSKAALMGQGRKQVLFEEECEPWKAEKTQCYKIAENGSFIACFSTGCSIRLKKTCVL